MLLTGAALATLLACMLEGIFLLAAPPPQALSLVVPATAVSALGAIASGWLLLRAPFALGTPLTLVVLALGLSSVTGAFRARKLCASS